MLEGGLLIRARRGRITIRNREALEEFAAEAYGTPEQEYERLIAPMLKRGGNVVQGRFPQHEQDDG